MDKLIRYSEGGDNDLMKVVTRGMDKVNSRLYGIVNGKPKLWVILPSVNSGLFGLVNGNHDDQATGHAWSGLYQDDSCRTHETTTIKNYF